MLLLFVEGGIGKPKNLKENLSEQCSHHCANSAPPCLGFARVSNTRMVKHLTCDQILSFFRARKKKA